MRRRFCCVVFKSRRLKFPAPQPFESPRGRPPLALAPPSSLLTCVLTRQCRPAITRLCLESVPHSSSALWLGGISRARRLRRVAAMAPQRMPRMAPVSLKTSSPCRDPDFLTSGCLHSLQRESRLRASQKQAPNALSSSVSDPAMHYLVQATSPLTCTAC